MTSNDDKWQKNACMHNEMGLGISNNRQFYSISTMSPTPTNGEILGRKIHLNAHVNHPTECLAIFTAKEKT